MINAWRSTRKSINTKRLSYNQNPLRFISMENNGKDYKARESNKIIL
ncbi:hypothetical protein [Helicobacter sp. 16-1353]|nr:hypothetical protein [Helicobacter sp. 16-1353]